MELRGLTSQEVEERIQTGQSNRTGGGTKSVGRIIWEHSMTLFNIVNLILAIAVAAVGSFKNMLFMGIVFSNTAIGVIQEIRSKRMVDKLSIMVSAKIEAIRDGQRKLILSDELVKDDLIHLKRGAQVPADAQIIYGNADVNESLLTGEPDLISKTVGDELFSGSFLAAGDCYAKLIRVGKESFASKIAQEAKRVKKAESEIMRTLKKIITIISCLLVPLGALLFINQLSLSQATVESAVVGTVAGLISMIPEGLMLLTSSVLAVAVIRLSQKQVLVQQLYCIETLARVDVLCLDKTGTITSGAMKVSGLLGFGNTKRDELAYGFAALAACSGDESPTLSAIREAFPLQNPPGVQRVISFSSEKKWSGVTLDNGMTYIMGAGEMILKDQYSEIEKAFRSKIGTNRVLLLATSTETFDEEGNLPQQIKPIGVLLIQDEIRKEAPDTIRYFQEQGVDLKVISGDGVATVAQIAEKAGIPVNGRCVDARTLVTDQDMEHAVAAYTVFGRVTPAQKRQLVRALQKQGHTVAMTGDGVNDVLAMKESDCSVAMASGSEAARNIAQLVLTTDDFSSMPNVVAEGRRSINNIQRSASMFLTKTIFAMLIGILFTVVSWQYPFQPIQMSFISTLTIGLPSLILALEPNRDRISGNFFYNIITRALSGGVTMAVGVLLVYAAGAIFRLEYEEISMLAVLLTAMTGVFLLYRISIPFNKVRLALFIFVISSIVLATVFFGPFFNFPPLSWKMGICILVIGSINGTVFFFLFSVMEKVRLKMLSPEMMALTAEKARRKQEIKAERRNRRIDQWEDQPKAYKGIVKLIAYPISLVSRMIHHVNSNSSKE
ncbi:MAG: HAD-IC family P-type ATPase [Firmicutes bacterium]|nr:HAD-IC family P-type ATPase [Bacillota bacterium]